MPESHLNQRRRQFNFVEDELKSPRRHRKRKKSKKWHSSSCSPQPTLRGKNAQRHEVASKIAKTSASFNSGILIWRKSPAHFHRYYKASPPCVPTSTIDIKRRTPTHHFSYLKKPATQRGLSIMNNGINSKTIKISPRRRSFDNSQNHIQIRSSIAIDAPENLVISLFQKWP